MISTYLKTWFFMVRNTAMPEIQPILRTVVGHPTHVEYWECP